MAADIVLFDYDTVGSGKRPEMRYDLPGGGRQLGMPERGVEYTIVNGAVLYRSNEQPWLAWLFSPLCLSPVNTHEPAMGEIRVQFPSAPLLP
jgi:hypothetical protein